MSVSDIFLSALMANAARMETLMADCLRDQAGDGEVCRPPRLMQAMRHGALNGGKGMRPFFLLQSAGLFAVPENAHERVAAALEFVHCYSLIHDDLPAMDDDALRRGEPTVHVAFDEATAILAGDALLTMAFDLIAGPGTDLPPTIKLELISELCRAAGAGGMAGGQMLDLQAEGKALGETDIIRLQAMKTGALFRFACEGGAIAGGAERQDRERLKSFGEAVGLAFQLADDLLDLNGDEASLGKSAGKDVSAVKATLPALHGEEWTRRQIAGLVAEAEALLEPYGESAALLTEATRFVASRNH